MLLILFYIYIYIKSQQTLESFDLKNIKIYFPPKIKSFNNASEHYFIPFINTANLNFKKSLTYLKIGALLLLLCLSKILTPTKPGYLKVQCLHEDNCQVDKRKPINLESPHISKADLFFETIAVPYTILHTV